MQRFIPTVLAAGVAVIALAACGSSSKTETPTTTTPAGSPTTMTIAKSSGPQITIKNAGASFAFATTPVAANETITVKNETEVQHTVSADSTAGGFDITVDPGKTATFTAPKQAGAYPFHCNIHTDMHATLTVT
jgi:plastocyanin